MIRRLVRAIVPCAILIAAGCSKPGGEVEGTVTLDGEPAAGVVVTFIPDYDAGENGLPASAITDENGRYKLSSTSDAQKGVFVSKHVVICETSKFTPPVTDSALKLTLPKVKSVSVPPAYANPDKSPLRFEVKAGPQTIDIPLNGKVQAKQ